MITTVSIWQAGVTDVQVVSRGFLTCGGDGTVKLVEIGSDSTVSTISWAYFHELWTMVHT